MKNYITFRVHDTKEHPPLEQHTVPSPLMFEVEGEWYLGIYHANGWFYPISDAKFYLARGSENAIPCESKYVATRWFFLSSSSEHKSDGVSGVSAIRKALSQFEESLSIFEESEQNALTVDIIKSAMALLGTLPKKEGI